MKKKTSKKTTSPQRDTGHPHDDPSLPQPYFIMMYANNDGSYTVHGNFTTESDAVDRAMKTAEYTIRNNNHPRPRVIAKVVARVDFGVVPPVIPAVVHKVTRFRR